MRWRAQVLAGCAVALLMSGCGPSSSPPSPQRTYSGDCKDADAQLDNGARDGNGDELAKAVLAYQDLLATRSNSICAKAGLDATDDLLGAISLQRAGLDGDAAQDVSAAIKARPDTPVPPGLTPNGAPWWQTGWLIILWQVLLGVLVGLAALVVLVALWRSLLRWGHGGGVQVTNANDPITPAGAGPGFSLLLRNSLLGLSTGPGEPSIDFVDPTNVAVAVPAELTDLVPQTKVLAAVLSVASRVFALRDLAVTAFLQTDSPQGPGVSLTVTRSSGGEMVRSISLWSADFPLLPGTPTPASDSLQQALYPLAAPAAVWALSATRPAEFAALGTRDWRSYAIFQRGSRLQAQGQVDAAREQYRRALGEDPHNLAALTNLGILELREIG